MSSEKESIVYVTNTLQLGGTERNLITLSNNLPTSYTSEIWSFDCGPDEVIINSPVRQFRRLARLDPIFVVRLARAMSKHPAKVFHVFHFAFGVHILLANLLLLRRKKLVFSFGSGRYEISSTVFRVYASLLNRFADSITSNSVSTSLDLQRDGIKKEKITIVENGHDVQAFKNMLTSKEGVPMDATTNYTLKIVSTGRLVESKRFVDLIEAIAILKSESISVKASILGDGPLRKSLQERIDQNGLQDMVKLLGACARDQVLQQLKEANLFAFPSETEGLPNSLIEASLANLPIVACDVGGVTDVVRNAENGILVPARNPAALAQAIKSLYRDPALARRLADSAQRMAEERFGIETMVDKFVSIYQQLSPARTLS